jgi:hypothetical protein
MSEEDEEFRKMCMCPICRDALAREAVEKSENGVRG